VEQVKTECGLRATLADHRGDPVGGVCADQFDGQAALRAEQIEEGAQGRLVPTSRCPHQPAAVVVDHHRQVAVLFAERSAPGH
jgi:hypothetical protein